MAGVAITGTFIKGATNEGVFPIALADSLRIPNQIVANIAGLTSLAEFLRMSYMTVYVITTGETWRLGVNTTIAGEIWTLDSADYILTSAIGAANGVVPLNASSKIDAQYIDQILITQVHQVDDIAAMLAFPAFEGDLLIVTDASADPAVTSGSATYVKLNDTPPTTALSDYSLLEFGVSVTSVNGKTGVVVLDFDDINAITPSQFAAAVAAHTSVTANAAAIVTNAGDITSLDSLKAAKTNVLELDNTTPFTPTADYQPATKKYVVDAISASGGGTVSGTGTNNQIAIWNGTVNIDALAAGTNTHVLTMVAGVPAWAAASGGGDMLLGTAQVVTALKTYEDGTIAFRNAGDTFNATFVNTISAARAYTLPNEDGEFALTSNVWKTSGTTSVDAATIIDIAGDVSIRYNTGIPGTYAGFTTGATLASLWAGSSATSYGTGLHGIEVRGHTELKSVDLIFKMNSTTALFTDSKGTPLGIQYGGDYTATFTDRSLIDKGFADASYWRTDGLTLITASPTRVRVTDGSLLQIQADTPQTDTALNIQNNNTLDGKSWLDIRGEGDGGTAYFTFDLDDSIGLGSGVYLRDTRTVPKGMYYLNDYSTGGIIAHGDRWILDKGFADSAYAPLGFTGNINLSDGSGGWLDGGSNTNTQPGRIKVGGASDDLRTAMVISGLNHAGAGGTGLAVGISMSLKNSTSSVPSAAYLKVTWLDAVSPSENAKFDIQVRADGTTIDAFKIEGLATGDFKYYLQNHNLPNLSSDDVLTIDPTTGELKTATQASLGGGGGSGDMLAATYDPTTVNGDAFDMDNMAEGTNLILTAGERTILGNTSNTNTGDQDLNAQRAESGAIYSTLITDRDTSVRLTNAGVVAITLNDNVSGQLPNGYQITILNDTGSTATISKGTDATIQSGAIPDLLDGEYFYAELISIGIWSVVIGEVGGGSGDVTKVGTPVNNQLGIWTGNGTIEGDEDITYDAAIGAFLIKDGTNIAQISATSNNAFMTMLTTSAGQDCSLSVASTAVNTASNAYLNSTIATSGGGDAFYRMRGAATWSWALGVDSSASNAWKLNYNGASTQVTPSSGTNFLTVTTAGLFTFNSNVGGGTATEFLNAAGGWTVPAGGGGGIGGSIAAGQVAFGSGTDTIQGTADLLATVAANGIIVSLNASKMTLGSDDNETSFKIFEKTTANLAVWLTNDNGDQGSIYLYNGGGSPTVRFGSGSASNYINNGTTIGLNTASPSTEVNVDIGGLLGVVIPSGTNAQRSGTPVLATMRWNTDGTNAEIYNGSGWDNMSSGGGGMGSLVEDTTPQLGGELDAQAHSIGGTVQTATGDGTTTIDWKLGNMFDLLLVAASSPEVLTFTAPTKPGTFMLKLKQHSAGGQTITWPGSVVWAGGSAPTLSTGNGAEDIITFYYNGTSYYGVEALDFS